MELTDYLRVLRKRWLSIVVLTALALAGAAAATLAATPEYQAQTKLFVRTASATSTSDLQQGNTFVQQRVQTYAEVARQSEVLDPVIAELGLDTTAGALAQRVTAEAPLDTVLINITVTDPSPQAAAAIANAVGASLIATVAELEGSGTGTTTPVQLTTTQPAVVPSAPSSPNTPLNLALGLLVGLAVGVGLAVLRETLDTTVRGEQDLDQLGVPVLAGMPYDTEAEDHPLVVVEQPRGVRSECFRQLRTNLQFATAASGARSVVVTSSLAGEGKSTTAINLALTLAGAGIRTALVDADLRRPMVATYLGLEGAAGLTTVLVGDAALDDVLQPWGENGALSVLTSGGVPPNPSELLASDHMAKVLHELEQRFDVVLLDGAPLLAVTDSAVLAEVVGGALVVVGSGRTRRPQVSRALQALSAVDATVLGAVLTMLPTKGVDAYQTYAYRYQPLEEEKPRHRRRAQGGAGAAPAVRRDGQPAAHRRPAAPAEDAERHPLFDREPPAPDLRQPPAPETRRHPPVPDDGAAPPPPAPAPGRTGSPAVHEPDAPQHAHHPDDDGDGSTTEPLRPTGRLASLHRRRGQPGSPHHPDDPAT